MKKLTKVAMLLASAAIATSATAQIAAADGGNVVNNWQNGTGELIWKNGTNDLCWRNAGWTAETAAEGCDGAKKPLPPPPPPTPAKPPVAEPAKPAAQPTASKVTYAADAFFDFDKATLKPDGRAKLDDLAAKIKSINLEVVVAVGHTDHTGSHAYNDKLSVRRAEAVKAYLVSKGIDKSRIYTEGKGKRQPIADNKTRAGRAQNRRVEVEVVGTRTGN